MSLKAYQMQAVIARRRELEHDRNERLDAVNRYYDHWGNVTTRFNNWTTPEYYKSADEKIKMKKDKKEKEKQLEVRREKLRTLFTSEKMIYDQEVKDRAKPRARKVAASTEQLQKIDANLKDRENIKRKLDLEAKLYGKWRHGVDDDNLIFESKTDNEALAKLNWMDRQIEEQMQREKQEAEAEERNLRLQEAISQTELVQKERQQIREQEIKEIRALQEKHMDELKERQSESEMIKAKEQQLRDVMAELDKEFELLDESTAVALQPSGFSQAYNLKKIKIFIRKRSDLFRSQVKIALDMLERVRTYARKVDKLDELWQKYTDQYEAETLLLSQIESMYESEAKFSLQRCEDLWQAQQMERYHELKDLLKGEQCQLTAQLNDNLQRQTDIVEVRSTHLSAIENSNEKLKQLIQEQQDSPRSYYETADGAAAASPRDNAATPRPVSSKSLLSLPAMNLSTKTPSQYTLPQLSKSFTNLNMDVWQDLPHSAPGGIDSPRLQSQRSLQVVTPETAERPKFARKRVAWN